MLTDKAIRQMKPPIVGQKDVADGADVGGSFAYRRVDLRRFISCTGALFTAGEPAFASATIRTGSIRE